MRTQPLTCVGRCQAASQHCINFAASAISSRRPSSSRLSLLWCCVDSTVVMSHWSASRPTWSADSSRCRTQRRDWYSVSVDLTTSRMHSSASTDHWLRVPERIIFKIAVQTYRALHGDASQYLRQFTPIADIASRQRLRSSSSDNLIVPAVRLPILLDVAPSFLVAGARIWNNLPVDVTSAPYLLTFRKRLKPHLFRLYLA